MAWGVPKGESRWPGPVKLSTEACFRTLCNRFTRVTEGLPEESRPRRRFGKASERFRGEGVFVFMAVMDISVSGFGDVFVLSRTIEPALVQ